MTDAPFINGSFERDDPRFEERFPIAPDQPLSLAVHNSNGEVRVRATDRTDVLLRSTKHGRPGSGRYDEATVGIDVEGNRIEIRAEHAGGGRRGWSKRALAGGIGGRRAKARADIDLDLDLGGLNVHVGSDGVRIDIEVELPRDHVAGTMVEVRNASGDVTIDGVEGTVNVTTASGDAHVRAVAGEVTAQSASGDLLVEQRAGGLTVRTASGDVQIKGGALDRVGAVTASGDLLIETDLRGAGPFTTQTVSGDVHLTGRLLTGDGGDHGATLTFQTVSGDAEVAPPLRKTGKRVWRLGPNDTGGPEIAVRTVSGDLRARLDIARDGTAASADAETAPLVTPVPPVPAMPAMPPMPPMPPRPPIAPEAPPTAADLDTVPLPPAAEDAPLTATDDTEAERLAVLQALERGDIDVDEALSRLETVGTEAVG